MLRRRFVLLPVMVAAVAAALLFPAAVGAKTRPALPSPAADYQFQNTRTSVGNTAAMLTDIGRHGTNTFVTDTVDGVSKTVLAFAMDHGLTMAKLTPVIANDQYSIVILAKFDQTDGYRRIIDFKNARVDTGLYADNGLLYFFNVSAGTQSVIKTDQYFQVVLTRSSATKFVVGYVDGVQQFSFKDKTRLGVISNKNTLRFFADDHASPGEDASGTVARIRVYNSVLSPADVASLDREPPG